MKAAPCPGAGGTIRRAPRRSNAICPARSRASRRARSATWKRRATASSDEPSTSARPNSSAERGGRHNRDASIGGGDGELATGDGRQASDQLAQNAGIAGGLFGRKDRLRNARDAVCMRLQRAAVDFGDMPALDGEEEDVRSFTIGCEGQTERGRVLPARRIDEGAREIEDAPRRDAGFDEAGVIGGRVGAAHHDRREAVLADILAIGGIACGENVAGAGFGSAFSRSATASGSRKAPLARYTQQFAVPKGWMPSGATVKPSAVSRARAVARSATGRTKWSSGRGFGRGPWLRRCAAKGGALQVRAAVVQRRCVLNMTRWCCRSPPTGTFSP